MNFNISDLPINKQVRIEHHKLDCLLRHHLRRYRAGSMQRTEIQKWFDNQPATWTESDNRRERMKQALIKLRRRM